MRGRGETVKPSEMEENNPTFFFSLFFINYTSCVPRKIPPEKGGICRTNKQTLTGRGTLCFLSGGKKWWRTRHSPSEPQVKTNCRTVTSSTGESGSSRRFQTTSASTEHGFKSLTAQQQSANVFNNLSN